MASNPPEVTPGPAAFCDTFDNPTANSAPNNRAGQLDGVLWGTAENTGDNPGDRIPTGPAACSGQQNVEYPANIEVCNGQLVDTISDQGNVVSLAMYPRQPFDFTGRTGTIAFDVSNDNQAEHAAWPELWFSDQPVPDPWSFEQLNGQQPRNGFGIPLADCPSNQGCAPNYSGVGNINVYNNYVRQTSYTTDAPWTTGGQVKEALQPGQMNHYEVQVSANRIDVYGTDAFTGTWNPAASPLKLLTSFENLHMNATRGLVWLEDEHYNGCKFNTQCLHTFRWDNLAFDGPVLPRDLGYDVPNNNVQETVSQGSAPAVGNAYQIPPNSSKALDIPDVPDLTVSGSTPAPPTGALLVFDFYSQAVVPMSVAVNGHDVSIPWPYQDQSTYTERAVGVPVPLADLQPGDNQVVFSAGTNAWEVDNIDLILQGAGGIPKDPQPSSPAGLTLRPGSATDVGVGANGSVWTVGTNPVSGGFDLSRWTGTTWTPVPGGAVAIAVDPAGKPWAVNSLHRLYHWNGTGWTLLPGAGTAVGVGANGSVLVVGTNPVSGGFGLWHRTGTTWTRVPGGAVAIAVDPVGNPWVVNSLHRLYHWNGTGWTLLPGAGTAVGVGANGSVWVVGTNPVSGGFGLWHRTGTSWTPLPGGAVAIAVEPAGNPWVIDSNHQIWS
jgi:hypothetical protein